MNIAVKQVQNNNVIAKIDSGASKNYFRECDVGALKSVTDTKGPMVIMPDNNGIQIKRQGKLPLPIDIVGPANTAYVLPGLKNSSLLSLGQFMDSGCWALVNSQVLNIYKDRKLVLQGLRNWTDGLWDVSLKRNKKHPFQHLKQSINALINTNKTKAQLANYLHACLFSLCQSTLQKSNSK